MPESLNTRLLRHLYNIFPAYRGTGGRLTYVASDFREIRVKVPLTWRTRNYVGTIYGGSMYGAVDPIYMVMLIKVLGPAYEVWDKSASVRFLKPGRTTLTARFLLSAEEIDEIRRRCDAEPSIVRTYTIELVDESGAPHALVEKVIFIRKKPPRQADRPRPRS